ncbi:MAG: hypothetical protein WBG86_17870, partial [Polyangiales bacterium]
MEGMILAAQPYLDAGLSIALIAFLVFSFSSFGQLNRSRKKLEARLDEAHKLMVADMARSLDHFEDILAACDANVIVLSEQGRSMGEEMLK